MYGQDKIRSVPSSTAFERVGCGSTLQAVGLRTELFDAGSWGMDMTDPFYTGDIRVDWGKPIKNLGVLGYKLDG
jgi:hypothetical protein